MEIYNLDKYELLSGDIICCTYVNGKLAIVNEKLSPFYLADFKEWVASRAIHSSRGLTARNLKVASGLPANEKSFETAMKVNAACITDNYWVREIGSNLSYKDISFERYDGFFRELALGMDHTYTYYKSDTHNPELTNIGGSDKAWVIDDNGDRWLYKRQPIRECYNEIFSSKLAAVLGIDTVEYELADYSNPDPEIGQFGIVRSRDFTQGKNINFESAQLIVLHNGTTDNDVLKIADAFSKWGIEQEYLNIKYLDILVGNPDRHSQNYGVLRDQSSGDVIGMAPNFDNNFAFFAREMEIDSFLEAAAKYAWKRPVVTKEALKSIADQMRAIDGLNDFDADNLVSTVIANNSFNYSLHEGNENTFSISFPSHNVRIIDDKISPGEDFIIVSVPEGVIYHGKDIGGYKLCPDQSIKNGNVVEAVFNDNQVKLHDKEGGYELVDISDLKDLITERTEEVSREREKDRSLDKTSVRSKKREEEVEL